MLPEDVRSRGAFLTNLPSTSAGRSRCRQCAVTRLTAMPGGPHGGVAVDHRHHGTSADPASFLSFGGRVAVALCRRPWLVPTALRQLFVVAPDRWWARPPYLPIPDADYLEFRQVTATGRVDAAPDVDDTILWLAWCREMRTVSRR